MAERAADDDGHFLGCLTEVAHNPFAQDAVQGIGIDGVLVTQDIIVVMLLLQDSDERCLHFVHQPATIQQAQRVAYVVIVLEERLSVIEREAVANNHVMGIAPFVPETDHLVSHSLTLRMETAKPRSPMVTRTFTNLWHPDVLYPLFSQQQEQRIGKTVFYK